MAAATTTSTSYGFRTTGGTDASTITTMRCKVKAFIFVPVSNDDTAAITDGAGNAMITLLGPDGGYPEVFDWYDANVDGLKVTLNAANNVLITILE